MSTVNEIISANLVKLRKKNKLTQAELAEAIHYSDKSVSKWEKGESCPSIAVAAEIAKFYGVKLDDLIDENFVAEETTKKGEKKRVSYLVITLLACSVVWLVSTIAFIYGNLVDGIDSPWLFFIYAIPVTCIVLLVFNSLWGNRRYNYLIISVMVWSTLTSFFVHVLTLGHVIWMLFLLGIPAQISIVLWSRLKSPSLMPDFLKRRKRSSVRKKAHVDQTSERADDDPSK